MPDLYACYFCGAVDDSLDTYAVIPSWLDPDEDEQVTVAACEECHEKLAKVVTPLVRRLEDETDGYPGETVDADADTGITADPTADRDGITFEGSESSARSVIAERTAGQASDVGDESADDRTEGDDGDETADDDRADDSAETGDGVEADDGGDADDRADTDDGSGTRDGDGGAVTDEHSDATEPAVGDGVDVATFRRVMRLLQNREFPVVRADFEVLATSAYDLDDEEVGRIVDAAIDRDLLAEDGPHLVRPERRESGDSGSG